MAKLSELAEQIYQKILDDNCNGVLCGKLKHCPMVGSRGRMNYSAAGIRAADRLEEIGRIVRVPYTPEHGVGWACAEALLPGHPLAQKLNGDICNRRNAIISQIASLQADLKTINKILGQE